MRPTGITIHTALLVTAMLTACPSAKDEETGKDDGAASSAGETQAAAETGTETTPEPTRPEAMPMLCSLDGGKWCAASPCGFAAALCCSSGTCIVSDGSPCAGTLGWCESYSTALDPGTGVKVATCHDGI